MHVSITKSCLLLLYKQVKYLEIRTETFFFVCALQSTRVARFSTLFCISKITACFFKMDQAVYETLLQVGNPDGSIRSAAEQRLKELETTSPGKIQCIITI